MTSLRSQSGFSLVELSIVLVILGLLTGGILAGQSLIRAAELRSVTVEYNQWLTATRTFQDKYFALPGDMHNATQFWGRMNANADCVTNFAAAVTTNGVCDGNGGGSLVDTAPAASQSVEFAQFWRHLASAGLVSGQYSGMAGPDEPTDVVAGVNTPKSKLSTNASWWANSMSWNASVAAFDSPRRNQFILGADSTSWNLNAVLSTEEAWNIDTKMDDGHATQGLVWATRFPCTGASSSTDYRNYDLAATGLRCGLQFFDGF